MTPTSPGALRAPQTAPRNPTAGESLTGQALIDHRRRAALTLTGEKFGQLDALLNVAGYGQVGAIEEVTHY
jgi:hypothetical protein